MRRSKRQKALPPEPPQLPPAAESPQLPQVERAFFDMLLQELSNGLQETEQAIRKGQGDARAEAVVKAKAASIADALRKSARARQTVDYAQALLRLDASPKDEQPETMGLPTLLNLAARRTRRAFLYAGTALRRASEEPSISLCLPKESFLFLLEEMFCCCLRCSPGGKNLHVGFKEIGPNVLLSLRTEGPALLQAPLIPLLPQEAPGEEDYGFALCRMLAARLEYGFRWEADGAGVRMFLEISDVCASQAAPPQKQS